MTSSNDSVHSKDTSSIEEVGGIRTAGDGDEFVIIGKQKFYKHELMNAFGGTLNPGLAPYPANKFANPAPLGLSAFSLTTFVLSMYNARAMGISVPNVVVGLAAFYGGAVQFLAGVWELAVGNTFGGTALTSYGAFWLSFAAINVENFGIAAAYGDDVTQFHNAVGFYLIAWGIFTFMLWLCTIKSTLAFTSLFFLLFLTFILLGAGDLTGKLGVTRAGGVMGVITAFVGFYNAFAGVATKQNSYFVANPIPLARK
ncbi:hypothetical protein PGUG_02480 [Meyerozyma guilliermondii ATCC 6260]|uniref:Ammonia transport outward protein 2 n=2 Tax=Dikarya TaxID=451864 RepID=A5DGS9_PICGU|nr:uncharacterized protein PGUG_02480 [Meyerozyma guilliermondii ATCC 6260]EDK38382.1 hypothetical protein PGUG_02480 [Meyerozyma guilliermondii ATCC 6260]KAJ9104854.1 Accumulation of dyads protein 2 [Naganishia cerealis]